MSVQFANLEELVPFIDYHRKAYMDEVSGLVDVEVQEDDEGAFVLLKIKEDPNDQRQMSVEALAGYMMWPRDKPQRQARVKVKKV